MNWGTFRNQQALAVQGHMRVNDFTIVNAGVGVGLRYGGVTGRAGVTFAW